ncbi:glycosyltransferase [uncultured Lentibacter sp.]|uniref:glycosyltransferase family 2 protein n=1 Tax=uncultured Lentibacter sp. TaxID=1659309 RepID=UPI002629BF19|nr:glycosyltransferase [uncultured Lentibacter sp.]
MALPSVSVVVVSQGRPESLLWCLTALAGQVYAAFEVVVVADPLACARVAQSRFAGRVKLVSFEPPNIAAARNRGVAVAAGEVIAFVDDDAAAEPLWLHRLVEGFALSGVKAVGGYVRGRNGISYQWRARQVEAAGWASPLVAEGAAPFVPEVAAGCAVKTEGTNMAVRRDVLVALGGFDEAFHFYLDETELNLRLAAARHKTALCPMAEVHHAYRASPRRKDDRTVRDLFDVGASTVVLQRKTGQPVARAMARMRAEQTARLAAQRRRGLMDTAGEQQVLQSLEAGFCAGVERPFGCYPAGLETPEAFLPFAPDRRENVTLAGRWRNRAALRRRAGELAAQGRNVSLYLFSFDTRFHHLRFDMAGYWEQAGGQFGKAVRSAPLVQLTSFDRRLKAEQDRVKHARGEV